ncbi:hypothetical protein [Streptomyces marianii]|nr:hypothetical protein [Streptomyces marianii]
MLSITLGGLFADRDAVPDGDLFGTDEDVLDQEPQDALTLGDLGRGGFAAELDSVAELPAGALDSSA